MHEWECQEALPQGCLQAKMGVFLLFGKIQLQCLTGQHDISKLSKYCNGFR